MARESAYFSLERIGGKHDAAQLKRELDTLPGVTSVSVNAAEDRLAVDFDTTGLEREQILEKLRELGFRLRSDPE